MSSKLSIQQKRGRQIRKYEVNGHDIKAEIKTDASFQSFTIKFDDIEFDEIIVDRKPNIVEIGFFISVLFNLICVVILISDWAERIQLGKIPASAILMAVASGMGIWAYNLFRFERQKILKGAHSIFLFYSKGDQQEVDDFIGALKVKQRAYFRDQYMQFDDTTDLWTYESRVKWLFEKNFVSKEEFKELQEDIKNKRLL